jgi:hypothetical protein
MEQNEELQEVQNQETEQSAAESTNIEASVKEELDYKALYEAELGRRKRAEKEALRAKKTEEPEKKSLSEKKQKLDYGELAYLEIQGIKTKEEREYLKDAQQVSGLDLQDLLTKPFIQAELKALRDAKSTLEAVPSASKRTTPGQSGKDTVDYWIKKDELPPVEQMELRRKVLNQKIHKEREGSKFSSDPIVSNVQF